MSIDSDGGRLFAIFHILVSVSLLAALFNKNFEQYLGDVPEAVAQQGPGQTKMAYPAAAGSNN